MSAMEQVERFLPASMVHFDIEDPRHVDAEWCFGHYFAELNARFENGFDPAQSISADAHELVPPTGLLLVARLGGEAIGCGALKFHGKQFAEVKRMWVVERLRGVGIARRLLRALEECAAAADVRQLRLETNEALHEAIALYKSSGFSEVKAFNAEPYAHHWFQKPVATHRGSPARTRSYMKPNHPQ
jgi:GNAT superfamily N-acetyltransferase